MEFIKQPGTGLRLGDFLKENLSGDWAEFKAAIAFVKRSGTRHIVELLEEFSTTRPTLILVGVDHRGTSKEGLEDLLAAVNPSGKLIIVHNEIAVTFHPKLYVFKSEKAAEVLIGSGNMTSGGLFTNYEASVRLRLNLDDPSDKQFLDAIELAFAEWSDLSSGTALILDEPLLSKLVANGYVPVEALATEEGAAEVQEMMPPEGDAVIEEHLETLFASKAVPNAPKFKTSVSIPSASPSEGKLPASAPAFQPIAAESVTGFVMTLQNTDVGTGQTTAGTTRRSPEVFIPLGARNSHPLFWGWPDQFVDTPKHYVRNGVHMRIGADLIEVNMMSSKLKHDLRLRNEALRSGGSIGDILRIEKTTSGGYDYYVEFIPVGTTMHPVYLARCTQVVGGLSKKLYGYY